MRRRLELGDAADQAEVLRLDLACTSTVARCARRRVEGEHRVVLGCRSATSLAEQRQQLDAFAVAEQQRVADDRIAALVQARQQRVVLVARGRRRAAWRARRRSRKSSITTISPPRTPPPVAMSSARPRPRRVPCQRASRGAAAQPVAAPRGRQQRVEGDADPAAEPVELRLGDGRRIASARCAAATRSSSGVSTPSKLASIRDRKSAGVARGRIARRDCARPVARAGARRAPPRRRPAASGCPVARLRP